MLCNCIFCIIVVFISLWNINKSAPCAFISKKFKGQLCLDNSKLGRTLCKLKLNEFQSVKTRIYCYQLTIKKKENNRLLIDAKTFSNLISKKKLIPLIKIEFLILCIESFITKLHRGTFINSFWNKNWCHWIKRKFLKYDQCYIPWFLSCFLLTRGLMEI